MVPGMENVSKVTTVALLKKRYRVAKESKVA